MNRTGEVATAWAIGVGLAVGVVIGLGVLGFLQPLLTTWLRLFGLGLTRDTDLSSPWPHTLNWMWNACGALTGALFVVFMSAWLAGRALFQINVLRRQPRG